MSIRPRILVVDDEESLRFSFEAFLLDEGYEVETAASLEECLTVLDAGSFDLVFMDILLGRDNGLDGLRASKQRNPHCPVVMITGSPEIETAAEAVRSGAFDYIPKPVRQETLLRVARMALRFKALADLRLQEQARQDAIFRSVQDGILALDQNLRLLAANTAARRLFGISEEALGAPLESCWSWPCAACLETVHATIASGRVEEAVRRESPGPRGTRVLSVVVAPLQLEGTTGGEVVMSVRDETRLTHLEHDLGRRSRLERIIGQSSAMQRVYELIDNLAEVETTALITGESGTGKELVAEALHFRSPRRARPLVKVNCAALPENLLESELFGHVKGAFTGAVSDRVGRFQLASGGTIFLDEIGDISPALQVRLLRVLQEREIERVGAHTPTRVDIRVIAATHRSLAEKVRRGEFREDLYYRLKVVEVPIPPLRERREDIPLLTEHFIKTFNARFKRTITGVSSNAEEILLRHPWPGNVRELEHALEHAFVRCSGNLITLTDLPPELAGIFRGASGGPDEERAAIRAALTKAGGNKSEAAKLLGISRRTIYRKMDELGLS